VLPINQMQDMHAKKYKKHDKMNSFHRIFCKIMLVKRIALILAYPILQHLMRMRGHEEGQHILDTDPVSSKNFQWW
jgi:hypothetical protein